MSGSANADAVDDGLALAGAVVLGEYNCDDGSIIADDINFTKYDNCICAFLCSQTLFLLLIDC